jgi:uncharacterized protein YigE (DUF2233 family)
LSLNVQNTLYLQQLATIRMGAPSTKRTKNMTGWYAAMLVALIVWSGCSREPATLPPSGSKRAELQQADKPRFTTIRVDARTERLELFLRDDAGRPFARFDSLQSWLATRNHQLRFAMNAGMFEPDLSPVGLLVQDGHEVSPLNLRDSSGNFYLKPNGVFLISATGARIVESSEYPQLASGVRLATQSGPLLLRNGLLHPAINAASTSRLVRNGVGISGDTIIFVISEQPVNFYELATFFRDTLHCPDALYLDGVVSSLYSADLQRNDFKVELGPMIGIVK